MIDLELAARELAPPPRIRRRSWLYTLSAREHYSGKTYTLLIRRRLSDQGDVESQVLNEDGEWQDYRAYDLIGPTIGPGQEVHFYGGLREDASSV